MARMSEAVGVSAAAPGASAAAVTAAAAAGSAAANDAALSQARGSGISATTGGHSRAVASAEAKRRAAAAEAAAAKAAKAAAIAAAAATPPVRAESGRSAPEGSPMRDRGAVDGSSSLIAAAAASVASPGGRERRPARTATVAAASPSRVVGDSSPLTSSAAPAAESSQPGRRLPPIPAAGAAAAAAVTGTIPAVAAAAEMGSAGAGPTAMQRLAQRRAATPGAGKFGQSLEVGDAAHHGGGSSAVLATPPMNAHASIIQKTVNMAIAAVGTAWRTIVREEVGKEVSRHADMMNQPAKPLMKAIKKTVEDAHVTHAGRALALGCAWSEREKKVIRPEVESVFDSSLVRPIAAVAIAAMVMRLYNVPELCGDVLTPFFPPVKKTIGDKSFAVKHYNVFIDSVFKRAPWTTDDGLNGLISDERNKPGRWYVLMPTMTKRAVEDILLQTAAVDQADEADESAAAALAAAMDVLEERRGEVPEEDDLLNEVPLELPMDHVGDNRNEEGGVAP